MVQAWSVDSSQYLVDGPGWRMRVDQCRKADGTPVGPIHVIEVPGDAVNVLALTADREVILVRESHHAAGVIALGIPGGGVEPGERNEDAIRRELMEETGYQAGEVRLLGSTFMNWRLQTNRVHHFLALDCTLAGPQALDEFEDIEIVLVPLDEFDPTILEQGFHLTTALLAREHI